MDYMMQTVRKNTNFWWSTGVFIGDLLQLPPVRDEEWRTPATTKEIFFHSHATAVRHYTLSYLQYTVRLTPSLFRF
jgi:hypothetical protein